MIADWSGDDPVADLDEQDVQDLYEAWRHKAPARANAIIRVLRLLLQNAIRFKMLARNPASRPGLVGADKSAAIWPEEAVRAFVAQADALGHHDIGTAVLLNEWLGQRPNDIITLTRGQYVNGGFTIRQGKTGAYVRIPASPEVAARLEAELARQKAAGREALPTAPLLICAHTGQPFTVFRFDKDFATVRKTLAAEHPRFVPEDGQAVETASLLFRQLRHTAVTRLAEAGCELAEIAAITGHTVKSVSGIIEHYRVRTTAAARSATAKRLARKEKAG